MYSIKINADLGTLLLIKGYFVIENSIPNGIVPHYVPGKGGLFRGVWQVLGDIVDGLYVPPTLLVMGYPPMDTEYLKREREKGVQIHLTQ